MQQYFPFTRLGLSRNPFGALTDAEWQVVTVLPSALLELCQQDLGTVQLIGERGHGKSTWLRALQHRHHTTNAPIPYETLPEGKTTFTTQLDAVAGFALDEAQRLSRWERRRLLRGLQGKRLWIGTHEDFRPLFTYWGRSVTTLYVADFTDRAHLAAVLARRVNYFALPTMTPIQFDATALDVLWQRFGANLRASETYLYELFQRLPTVTVITADLLGF
jgi:hypothetical protein